MASQQPKLEQAIDPMQSLNPIIARVHTIKY